MNGPVCGGCQYIEDGYFSKGWLLITLPDGALQEHACWEHARGWKMERGRIRRLMVDAAR